MRGFSFGAATIAAFFATISDPVPLAAQDFNVESSEAILDDPLVEEEGEVLRLAPAGKWVLDYTAESCSLRRLFGAGESEVGLELRSASPTRYTFRTTVSGKALRLKRKNANYRFAPFREFDDSATLHGEFAGGIRGAIFTIAILPSGHEKDAHVSFWQDSALTEPESSLATALTFEVGKAFDRRIVLETGEMAGPMRAMQVCLAYLISSWGVDAEAHRGLAQAVELKNLEEVANRMVRSYPKRMLRSGQSGLLSIRMLIDEEGRPSDCVAPENQADPKFGETACSYFIRYAKFNPAINGNGEEIASFYIADIRFVL